MKLFGNSRGGRHAASRSDLPPKSRNERPAKTDKIEKPPIPKWKKRLIVSVSVFFSIILVFGVVVYAYLQLAVAPPPTRDEPRGNLSRRPGAAAYQEGENPSNETDFSGRRPAGASGVEGEREERVYTFLVFGLDDWNTDVIMAINFDATNYTLDVVNIPRDTLVNVSWNIRKANSIYGAMHTRHRGQPNADELIRESMIDMFADVLGFEVDFMVMVDMRGFVRLVDAIGGVDFYVPVNMFYEDPYQDLFINIRRGQQRLNGRQALNAMRFRNLPGDDIGRIGNQQDFLMAAATQILQNSNTINITEMATIFLRYVDTDLDLRHLIYMGRAFLRMDVENINFHMMPHNLDWIAGGSYVSIILDEWIDMVNEVLSPWSFDFVAEDFSILTRGPDGALFVTDGNWAGNQNWGRGSIPPRPAQQPATSTQTQQTPNATTPSTDTDVTPRDEDFEPPYDTEPHGATDTHNLPLDDPYPDANISTDTDTAPPPESAPPDSPPDAGASDD